MWDKQRIQQLLDGSDKAVMRAVVAIYDLQTQEEKNAQATRLANNVGFGAYDAAFLSDIAVRIKNGYTLSPKQLSVTRNKIKRYHRQLAEIANIKEVEKLAAVARSAADTPMRLKSVCQCENLDGEGICDWCLDPENAEMRAFLQEIA